MLTFLVDSDLHFEHEIKSYKRDHVNKIKKLCETDKIDALICPGDLTENGWDGSHLFCWKYGGEYSQLAPLKEQYVEPLEKVLPVYLCHGNHDEYVPKPYLKHGVIDYIKKRHGDKRYSFDKKDVHFICLAKYPDKDSIKFLKKDLEENCDKDTPIIIFFHYNLVGSYSDWWTDEEKETLYETVCGYNIIAFLVGHHHVTFQTEWKGYKVVTGAAAALSKCTYKDGELTVEYV